MAATAPPRHRGTPSDRIVSKKACAASFFSSLLQEGLDEGLNSHVQLLDRARRRLGLEPQVGQLPPVEPLLQDGVLERVGVAVELDQVDQPAGSRASTSSQVATEILRISMRGTSRRSFTRPPPET